MRRERKLHLRTIAINDIVARWQQGQDTFANELQKFKPDTEATADEMTRFALLIEEDIIRHMQNSFDTVKRVKPPALPTLCQKLGVFERRFWSKTLLISRMAEFIAIIQAWKMYYHDRIVEAAIVLYKDMLDDGISYNKILRRIQTGKDISYIFYDTVYVWTEINTRLEIWLKIETGRMKGALQTFVEDAQNIHTAPISTQTNATLALLMATPVPEDQKTVAEIVVEWSRLRCRDIDLILADVRLWGSKAWIVTDGDYLYRNMLQHLWAKIKEYPTVVREELIIRLYQECRDAYGMCAQGHIARLANVLVGFDAAFKGEVSLQDRMAEISRQEISEEAKRVAALLVLNEFNVADADRGAWLEAF